MTSLVRRAALLLGAVVAVSLPFAAARAVDIKEVTTPLGIKAWLVEDKSVPVVTLSFSFAGGTATDPEGQKGVTNLMATLLTDGAGPFPAQAFRQRLEDAAVSLGFSASHDRLNGSLRMLSASRQEGFELLRLALALPRFDLEMVDRRRAQFVSSLNQGGQRPATVAERTLASLVFANHPYSIDTQGRREALQSVPIDDIKQRSTSLLVRQGLIVAAVGDIDEATLARNLDRAFGGLPAGASRPSLPDWTPPAKARLQLVDRPVPQSAVRMALPGILRGDTDWYPAFVMNHILGGGGQQSRLFSEVRERRGLAYSVSSSLRTYDKAGLVVISTASANERVADALRVIRAEMARLRNDMVGEAELNDAKTYLTGALPVSLDSSGSIASLLHSLQVDRLPRDQIEKRAALIGAVTADDIRRMARRLLRDDLMTTVVVGKPIGLVGDP